MRRTVLSATAAACVAVLASTVPAFAHGATPTARPSAPSTAVPSARPSAPGGAEPSAVPTRVPSAVPTRVPSAVPSAVPGRKPGGVPAPVPSAVPGKGRGQVSVVPSGAPDTGVTTASDDSDWSATLIGGSTAGALAVGGAAVFLVRRRRATGV
ncbi:sortase-dependent protein [Streptomyces sp. NPDC005435]|uniref:sortase-dependent protein n=1 Tax=Streptomyces sp. NPDC005435 TaxID=3154464 RepID=UPI003456B3B1